MNVGQIALKYVGVGVPLLPVCTQMCAGDFYFFTGELKKDIEIGAIGIKEILIETNLRNNVGFIDSA